MSGNGEMHVKRVDDDVAKLWPPLYGIGSGDVHGDVSDDDVGMKRCGFALNDIFLKFPSLLFFASTCSMMMWMIRFKLFALQCTASFSERFIERLVRSFALILSFSDFPNENLRFLGSLKECL